MRRFARSFVRIAAFPTVLLLANASVFAQTPTPAQPLAPAQASPAPPAVFKSTAALVVVDVLVSDGAGPIHGIPRAQFHVFEDGKEQKLVAAEEHSAADAAPAQKPPELPPNIYVNLPETPPGGTVNVLLLDALNTPLQDQAYVRQQMIAYLKNIQPGTRLAIFTLASRLRMVQGFTGDSAPLVAALSGKSTTGRAALPSQSALLADPNDTTSSDTVNEMSQMGASAQAMSSIQQFQADQAAFQMDLRVRYTLDALQELARYLGAVPGPKNLIWFSGSFPLDLDPDATLHSPFEAMRTYADEVGRTSAMLAASRVAVYPVDARGLLGDTQFSAQTPGRRVSGGGGGNGPSSGGGSRRGTRGSGMGSSPSSPTQPKVAQDSMKFFEQTSAEHATMEQIANETGGHAYYDTNGIKEAVAQVIQNSASYYTLAYTPESQTNDGRFHKIQVTIPEALSYKLVYRRGYVAQTPRDQAKNAPVTSLAAAILRGSPPFSEIIFKIRALPGDDPLLQSLSPAPGPAGEISPKVKGPFERYWIDGAADLRHVTLAEAPDSMRHASLEFAAVAYDRDGDRLNYIDKVYTINIPQAQLDQLLQKGLPIHQQIDLPAGEV